MRVILVGAGISNALIAMLLRRHYGPGIKFAIFDKAQNIGGRMSTSHDTDDNQHCFVDIGAQYLTHSKKNHLTAKYFQQLIDDHIIQLLNKQNAIGIRENEDKIDYMAPRGMSSIVRYFFEQAVVEMHLSKHLTQININSTNNRIEIADNEELRDEAEAVIVSIPVPQVLSNLQGSIADLIENNPKLKSNLAQVKYSTRFAVGLFYSSSITNFNIPWSIYYVDKKENDCLRYLAVDNAKRDKHEPPFSVIAHTSVEFGAEHADEDKVVVGEQVMKKIFDFLPELPRDVSNKKFHKWRYSQVMKSYPDKPGCVILNEHPLLILAGDSFAAESNFEACIEAAIETVKQFVQRRPHL